MAIVKIVLGIVIILSAIALIVLVLMQSGKGKELGSALVGSSSNSYLGNSKASDKDRLLVKATAILAVVLTLCVMALFILA